MNIYKYFYKQQYLKKNITSISITTFIFVEYFISS
jgi:hypothetical protein